MTANGATAITRSVRFVVFEYDANVLANEIARSHARSTHEFCTIARRDEFKRVQVAMHIGNRFNPRDVRARTVARALRDTYVSRFIDECAKRGSAGRDETAVRKHCVMLDKRRTKKPRVDDDRHTHTHTYVAHTHTHKRRAYNESGYETPIPYLRLTLGARRDSK